MRQSEELYTASLDSVSPCVMVENDQVSETDNGDFHLTDIQLEMVRQANDLVSSVSKDCKSTMFKVVDLRKSVYDAIVQLSEVVSEEVLKKQLPFLHCTAWDEVIEERHIGTPHLCGFPTCSRVVEMRAKKQKYYIDRQTRKIYENRSESDMYCSRSCMLRSAAVRAQLPDEPLWLTGNIEKRICSSYCVDTPIDLKHTTAEKTVIEIVRAVEDKLSDLIIREAESSSASEAEEEEENQTDVEGYLNEVSDIIGIKEDLGNKSNQGTRSSKAFGSGSGDMSIEMEATKVRSDDSHSLNGRVLKEAKDPPRNPRLPDPQMSANHSFTRDELEKLSRLRSKYSRSVTKKPIIIEPLPSAARSTDEKNRNQHEQRKLATAVMCPNVETAVERVEMLFRSWITERTRRLLRTGGLCVSDSINAIMNQFFRPHSIDENADGELPLPDVDWLNIHKKRLHIFVETIKKPFAAYQRELESKSSEFNWLYVIAATFNLEPNTITNFDKDLLKLICAVLLKLISMVDNVVEDSLFPNNQASDTFVNSLTTMGININVFNTLISKIVGSLEEMPSVDSSK